MVKEITDMERVLSFIKHYEKTIERCERKILACTRDSDKAVRDHLVSKVLTQKEMIEDLKESFGILS